MPKVILRRPSHIKYQTTAQTRDGDAKKVPTFEVIETRLHLLEQICSSLKSAKQQLPVISSFNEIIRYALNASASSLVLLDSEKKEINKYADGPLGNEFVRIPMNEQADTGRWLLQIDKPLIINEINRDEYNVRFIDDVTGLKTRSIVCAPLIISGRVMGIIKALNKLDGNDFNDHDLQTLVGLAANIALTIKNMQLNESLLYSYKDTLKRLVSLFDARESAASRHSIRVSECALIGANELSLSDDEKRTIVHGAILHDIGLLSIPEHILNKRDALTKEELDMIRRHPVIGYNLLRGIPSLNEVSKLILYHHEKYDGRGYPSGLRGETIPMGARLIAVADAFVSMTEKHSYRAPIFVKDALEEIGKFAGRQFCPVAAKAFLIGYVKSRSQRKVVVGKRPLSVQGMT
jgi:HD-GYP domain-containing protein (c-di-GMP phosphodiesterase class II)